MIQIVDKAIESAQVCRDFLVRLRTAQRLRRKNRRNTSNKQDLRVYWDESFLKNSLVWGEKTVWEEIKFLLVGKAGKVLDIACGTGKTMSLLSPLKTLTIFGCDISDFLLKKAEQSGISNAQLKVCDATNTGYSDFFFDYSYSIGSLEHFTEEGIDSFIKEASRITKKGSFHQIPVLKHPKFKGWIELDQSYFNMPESWWLPKFQKYFQQVYVLNSSWNDPISFGRWFLCFNEVLT